MLDLLLNRRSLGAVTLSVLANCNASARLPWETDREHTDRTTTLFMALENELGGRLGVFASEPTTNRTISFRQDERFAMCSTHKVLVGAAVLSHVQAGLLRIDQKVPYDATDILEYAPITKKNLPAKSMTLDALCEAAVRWSDNTAANLLLKLIGGPAGWTNYARSIGDDVSRLDRFEPDLNSAILNDPRDTSTPRAMTDALEALFLGNALNGAFKARLTAWMIDSPLTATLLRAGLPSNWRIADKSGSGANGSRNDVGVLYPPEARPIIVSIFTAGSAAVATKQEWVIARSATIIEQAFLGRAS